MSFEAIFLATKSKRFDLVARLLKLTNITNFYQRHKDLEAQGSLINLNDACCFHVKFPICFIFSVTDCRWFLFFFKAFPTA